MPEAIEPNLVLTAKEKLKSGKPKQETFEELVNEFETEPLRIAKIIRFIPTEEKKNKYFPFSVLTSALILILIIVEIYFSMKSGDEISKKLVITSVVSIIIIIGMLKSNAAFHSGAGFFGAARLLIFGLHFFLGENFSLSILFVFEVIFSSAILILGFYLRTKLDSRYTIELDPEMIDSTKGISFPD